MKNRLCNGASDCSARVLSKAESCIVYRQENPDGALIITEHAVFPGIWLCYKDAHTQKFTYPETYPEGVLEITHCREGRFEYDAGDCFFYLTKGDMAITRSAGAGAAVYCPTGHYHGISVILDPAKAPHCLSCLLEDVEVRPAALLEKFCRGNGYFLMRSTARIGHIFSELYAVPPHLQAGYFKVKVLELLLFLSGLDLGLDQTAGRSCSRSQAELAKAVCRFITEHMDSRLTIGDLAAQFYVSPAQLKKCFYSVYGESVQAYIRAYKMRAAAHCLRHTEQSVSEIASAFGYENSSKFSRAFRSVLGCSPMEYRKNPEEKVAENIFSE